MSEKLKFYKGLEENLVNITIEPGAIYHCTDTGNTYIGVTDLEGEILEDGTYPLKLDLYSTVSDIYISDDEIEGGSELVNADTLGGFPADEYALKSHVYEKIDEININSYATKEEVNALTYENVGAAPAGDYATKDDLNAIDFPVDSINGKTGAVALVAEDVGAPTIEYAKKVGAPHNLLDNSDFRNPVNQRGSSTYTLGEWGGYCIDRWGTYSNGMTMTLDSNGLTLNGGFFQPISNTDMARYNNKTLTFAAKIEGVIYCCHGVYTQGAGWRLIARMDNPYGYISFENEGNDYLFAIINTSESAIIEWTALYEGEYTAETLPEYQPKGYAAELMECRRYFFGNLDANVPALSFHGYMHSQTDARITIPNGINMRIDNPTLTFQNFDQLRMICCDGTMITPTAITQTRRTSGGIVAYISFSASSTLPTGPIVIKVNSRYSVSADL